MGGTVPGLACTLPYLVEGSVAVLESIARRLGCFVGLLITVKDEIATNGRQKLILPLLSKSLRTPLTGPSISLRLRSYPKRFRQLILSLAGLLAFHLRNYRHYSFDAYIEEGRRQRLVPKPPVVKR